MSHVKQYAGIDGPASTAQPKAGIPYRAMFDFAPTVPEELQMHEGDVLEIIDRQHGWWSAILNGWSIYLTCQGHRSHNGLFCRGSRTCAE
jgi:hypothetical protein